MAAAAAHFPADDLEPPSEGGGGGSKKISRLPVVKELIKLKVSFAKEPYKRDDILQKRPIISSICSHPIVPRLRRIVPRFVPRLRRNLVSLHSTHFASNPAHQTHSGRRCSVLQCAAVRCSVVPCVSCALRYAACGSMIQRVAVCCSVLQRDAVLCASRLWDTCLERNTWCPRFGIWVVQMKREHMKRTQTLHTLENCYFGLQDFDTDAFDAFCVLVCEDTYEAEVGMASADLALHMCPVACSSWTLRRTARTQNTADYITARYEGSQNCLSFVSFHSKSNV